MPLRGNPLADQTRYQPIRDLGEGSYGFVQLALDTHTNLEVAIKFWSRGPESITKMVEREVIMHSNFVHQHVIQFRDVFLTNHYLCLVMEYAPGGDLLSYLNAAAGLHSNTEEIARWFFQQLVLAVDYCHKKNVINRDIKLENTLLTLAPPGGLPLIKLTDFGFCKNLVDSLARSQVGTPAYIAPEVVLCQTGYDGKAADLWSCGVMLYIMLFLRYPFQLPDDMHMHEEGLRSDLMRKIIELDYDIPEHPPISAACKDLLSRLLCRGEHRLTMEGIRKHPWFRAGAMDVDEIWKYNDVCLSIDPHAHDGYPTIPQIERILKAASQPLVPDDRALSRSVSDQSSTGRVSQDSTYTHATWLDADD